MVQGGNASNSRSLWYTVWTAPEEEGGFLWLSWFFASECGHHFLKFHSRGMIVSQETATLYKKAKHALRESSVQFSHSVVSDSLQPQGLQHARPPCPSPTPEACSHSCPSSWRYHPTISSSVFPFSSRLQSFPASGSFPMSQLFTSGGQSIGVSAPTSVLPMNIQDWFPSGWTVLISLQSKGLSRIFSNSRVQKHLSLSLCYVWETFYHFVKAESFPSQSWCPVSLEDTQSVLPAPSWFLTLAGFCPFSDSNTA